MTGTLVEDQTASGAGYAYTQYNDRIVHRLSDGSWVAILKHPTTNVVTVYHSPDKLTWTSRGTFSVDSWHAERMLAAALASNNDLHITWINSAGAMRYVKMTYTAGTPTWAGGTQETVSAAPGGTIVNEAPSIEVLDSGVVVVAWARNPQQYTINATPISARVRCRNSGGTWGTEQNIVLVGSGGAAWTRHASFTKLARDAGGASGGVQKCWLMCNGAIHGHVTTHKVLSVTIATGNFTLATPVDPLTGVGAKMGDWATVFSHSADRWRFAGYKVGTDFTNQSTLYASEASSTALITSAAAVNVFGQHGTDLNSPPYASVTAFYLPDRIVFAGSGTGLESISTRPPYLTLFAFIVVGGVFVPTSRLVQDIGGGMANVLNNTDTFLLSSDANRNQAGTDHCLFIWERSTFKLIAYTTSTPTQTGTPVLVPAAGATVTTDIPTLSRSLVPQGHKVQWNLAEDAGFTVNVKTDAETDSAAAYASGTHAKVLSVLQALRQVAWHMRSRLVNIIGQTSAYVATQTFTVTHPPSATPTSPTGDQTKDYGAGTLTFDWTYGDTSPVDPQTAYQIIVERNSDGAAVADTGKIVAAGVAGTENFWGVPQAGRGTAAIGAGFKDITLRWKVRVWDSDDVAGAYSAYALFRTSTLPVVAITSPAEAAVVAMPGPTISWTFTASGRTQSSYRVVVTATATGAVVYDSGTKAGADLSHALPSILANGLAYSVAVTVTDNVGLSATDSNAFTTAWTAPAAPSGVAISATDFDTLGYISIGWNATVRDAEFYGWRIYRRLVGDTGYGSLVYETTSAAVNTFNDWTAGSGVAYEYTVVQVATRFGSPVESVPAWVAATGTSSYYWLIHPTDSTKTLRLNLVVSDDYTDEYESETHNLPGRGRKTDFGTHWGKVGSMTCQVYDTPTLTARQVRQQIFALKDELEAVYLRNPFGDLWLVSVGDLAVSRIAGVGTREFVTLTIPYTEVT